MLPNSKVTVKLLLTGDTIYSVVKDLKLIQTYYTCSAKKRALQFAI